jgi:hypothetical protein
MCGGASCSEDRKRQLDHGWRARGARRRVDARSLAAGTLHCVCVIVVVVVVVAVVVVATAAVAAVVLELVPVLVVVRVVLAVLLVRLGGRASPSRGERLGVLGVPTPLQTALLGDHTCLSLPRARSSSLYDQPPPCCCCWRNLPRRPRRLPACTAAARQRRSRTWRWYARFCAPREVAAVSCACRRTRRLIRHRRRRRRQRRWRQNRRRRQQRRRRRQRRRQHMLRWWRACRGQAVLGQAEVTRQARCLTARASRCTRGVLGTW